MGARTRKELLRFCQDNGIPLRLAIELLEQAEKKLTGKPEKETHEKENSHEMV